LSYISREALLEKEKYLDDWNIDLSYVDIEDVKSIPSADVRENVKGKWIKIQSGDKDFPEIIVCNKCYHENSHLDFNEHNEPIGKVFVKSNFCPNCGADMRKESEIHCNCTDEEIAKSFIEDVEAVKDLLPRAESEDSL